MDINKAGTIIGVAIVAVAGYFGGQELGLFGERTLSDADISDVLQARADEINASGDLKYDDWSRVYRAVHIEKQLTVYAASLLKSAAMSGVETYMESREVQAAKFLCRDTTMRAVLSGGGRFVYQWRDADEVHIGTVNARGASYCTDHGH